MEVQPTAAERPPEMLALAQMQRCRLQERGVLSLYRAASAILLSSATSLDNALSFILILPSFRFDEVEA
jgi:hypothetical protein